MPRIKRWFPVNHNINRDPEVWAMRHELGEKSLSIWLEFLSIADQNDGEIPGELEPLLRSVSGTCQSSVVKVRAVYHFSVVKVWLKREPTLHVVKYWDYHRHKELKPPLLGSLPSEPSELSEPSEPKKNPKKDSSKRGSPRSRKTNPQTGYPDDFKITEGLRSWCLTESVTDPETYLEPFRDYHIAKGSRFADWPAAFRNWIRRRDRFGPRLVKNDNDDFSERTKRILKRGL